MKTIINKHMKFKSISRAMNSYPEAFEEKPKALAMKDEFTQCSDDMTEVISKLLRPISTIHRPKQDSQQKFVVATEEYIGMGILLATDLKNMPLLDILKVYKSRIIHVSAFKSYEIAVHVAEELEKQATLAAAFGLTAEKLIAYKALIADFGETLDSTGALLTDRKSGWNDIKKMVVSNSKLLRLQIDPFMIFHEQEFPDLFKDYMLVRGSRKRRKRAIKADSTTGDISGTVTDSVTGLAVANATINVVEQEAAYTTDADGYYLIDELEGGSYTITCHATGYEVPQQVTCEMTAGQSLVVDFSLVPVIPLVM